MTQDQFQQLIKLAGADPASLSLANLANQIGTFADPSEPFVSVNNYTIPAVAGSVLNGQQITLNVDFDLFCYAVALGPYTVHTTTPFSLLLKSQGGQVLFGNAPVRSDVLWSDARPVFHFHNPFKILKGVNMTVDLTNNAAGANTVQIALLCWKSNSAFAQS